MNKKEKEPEEFQMGKDLRILGEIRDNLFAELKKSKGIQEKISLSIEINHTIQSRQNVEVLLMRMEGWDPEDEECPGCEECNPQGRNLEDVENN